MPGERNNNNSDSLKRDLLRDFCLASVALNEQFVRFEGSGALSFSIISSVVGSENNKGLLWRVKDTAHHLFDGKNRLSAAGGYLDWTIGFLFHECLQLLESAYQLQYYGPRLTAISNGVSAPGMDRAPVSGLDERDGLPDKLFKLSEQSSRTLAARIARCRELMDTANELFCRYFKGECANRPLARLIYDREELLRQVLGPLFTRLLDSIYDGRHERAFLESAVSLAEIGHSERAARALRLALEISPGNAEATRLLDGLDL